MMAASEVSVGAAKAAIRRVAESPWLSPLLQTCNGFQGLDFRIALAQNIA